VREVNIFLKDVIKHVKKVERDDTFPLIQVRGVIYTLTVKHAYGCRERASQRQTDRQTRERERERERDECM
jgi:hypothetical protein